MVRNVVIAALAFGVVALFYQYQLLNTAMQQQSQLIIETRDKAEKELQGLRDKLASEERNRQVAEKDAKAVSAKLAEEQAARDAAGQTVKATTERLAQVQTALENAEKALVEAQKAKEEALETLAKERGAAGTPSKPAG